MKTAMQLIRKNETPVLRCDCGEIFCIDARDSILTMGLKDRAFRAKHATCIQKKERPQNRDMPEFHTKRR